LSQIVIVYPLIKNNIVIESNKYDIHSKLKRISQPNQINIIY